MTVRKDETWHSYENFQYIKFIYSEMWFNFPHFIFFTESKIICVSMSKNPSKLRIPGFSFLLHLTRQKGPSSSCWNPCVKLKLLASPYMLSIHFMPHRMNLAFKIVSKFPLVSKVEALVREVCYSWDLHHSYIW